ncbi:MAG TPA: TadE family protein [Pyrinomonadaceae bacterium]|jgi:Flp pilus assembly protein TadG|nr:TadE family protein [Pyrinomonadaceae bacterium]
MERLNVLTTRLAKSSRAIARRGLSDERGTQLVELAIVLPVMLLLFASVAEFGRYFYTYATLAKAARGAARYSTTRQFDSADITQAKSLAAYGDPLGACAGTPILQGLSCANVDIQQATSGGAQTVTARIINYQYQPIFDLGKLTGISTLSLKVNVSPSVTMKYVF